MRGRESKARESPGGSLLLVSAATLDRAGTAGRGCLRAAPRNGEDWSNARRIRKAVDQAAQIIGKAYLSEVKHRWPWGAEGPTSLVELLRKFVRKNMLSREEAHEIERQFRALLGAEEGEVRPFQELATLGLIGYTVRT